MRLVSSGVALSCAAVVRWMRPGFLRVLHHNQTNADSRSGRIVDNASRVGKQSAAATMAWIASTGGDSLLAQMQRQKNNNADDSSSPVPNGTGAGNRRAGKMARFCFHLCRRNPHG